MRSSASIPNYPSREDLIFMVRIHYQNKKAIINEHDILSTVEDEDKINPKYKFALVKNHKEIYSISGTSFEEVKELMSDYLISKFKMSYDEFDLLKYFSTMRNTITDSDCGWNRGS